MDIQQHSQTAKIKQLSALLFQFLSVIRILLYLGWAGILLVLLLVDEGTFVVGGYFIEIQAEAWTLKLGILVLFAVGLVLLIRIVQTFRRLMHYFRHGEIFNVKAIEQVKFAIHNALMFVALNLTMKFIGWYLSSDDVVSLLWSLVSSALVIGVFFGVISTLLWALQIGCDLNEESEMTI